MVVYLRVIFLPRRLSPPGVLFGWFSLIPQIEPLSEFQEGEYSVHVNSMADDCFIVGEPTTFMTIPQIREVH